MAGKLTPAQRRLRYATRSIATAIALAAAVAGAVLADRAGLWSRPSGPDWDQYEGKSFRVINVVDGDTLDVDAIDGTHAHTRIRLIGVDTPETKKPDTPVQHFGPQAAAFTKELTLGKDVTLRLERSRTRDKYERLLAYVYLPDETMLNSQLVAQGYGYADPRFRHTHDKEFARLQKSAMSARLGLWKDVTRDDLPYYYRDTLKLP
jgi:micrococcal nuclease